MQRRQQEVRTVQQMLCECLLAPWLADSVRRGLDYAHVAHLCLFFNSFWQLCVEYASLCALLAVD